ncbi:SDR family NAD(P)-dependent oxidoreductase [Metabacillus herbersteinensis]|uniref:SDR family NAD(P)-dependent oxidoreductase n=1 Tax=Metabacillus herbersteinensis TaxID=283816 RepID=A0ABV6GJG0_9BACI
MSALVITGGGTGLGLELAKQYEKNYDHVILTGRTLKNLKKAKRSLEEIEISTSTYELDIREENEINAFFHDIFNRYDVTALINNAGVGHFSNLESISSAEVHEMIDTNVKGTIFMCKEVLPYYKKQNAGKILNIVSTAGLRGKVNESVYVASKFAVRGFTESLVKELEDTKIVVTAAYMGGMDTPFWDDSDHIKDKSRLKSPQQIAKAIYQQDNGQPEIHID